MLGAGGLAVVLVLLAVWQILRPSTPSPVHQISKAEISPGRGPVSPAAGATAQQGSYAEVEARPLFRPDRRPPATQEADPPAAQTQALERYAVLGIIAAPARATALIREPSGKVVHLRAGQALDGWTLVTITPKGLVFTSGGRTQELAFKINSAR